MVASDGKYAFGAVGGCVVVFEEKVEHGERTGMRGFGEEVACEHEDIIGLVIGYFRK